MYCDRLFQIEKYRDRIFLESEIVVQPSTSVSHSFPSFETIKSEQYITAATESGFWIQEFKDLKTKRHVCNIIKRFLLRILLNLPQLNAVFKDTVTLFPAMRKELLHPQPKST